MWLDLLRWFGFHPCYALYAGRFINWEYQNDIFDGIKCLWKLESGLFCRSPDTVLHTLLQVFNRVWLHNKETRPFLENALLLIHQLECFISRFLLTTLWFYMWTRFRSALTGIDTAFKIILSNLGIDVTSIILEITEWYHAHVESGTVSKVAVVWTVVLVNITYATVVSSTKITTVFIVAVERWTIFIIGIFLIWASADAVSLVVRIFPTISLIWCVWIAISSSIALIPFTQRLLISIPIVWLIAYKIVLGPHLWSTRHTLICKPSKQTLQIKLVIIKIWRAKSILCKISNTHSIKLLWDLLH